MHPTLAHHAGEQALLPLLLLAGTWVPAVLAIARARLARRSGKTAGRTAARSRQAGEGRERR
jgi:hypothetical protein